MHAHSPNSEIQFIGKHMIRLHVQYQQPSAPCSTSNQRTPLPAQSITHVICQRRILIYTDRDGVDIHIAALSPRLHD